VALDPRSRDGAGGDEPAGPDPVADMDLRQAIAALAPRKRACVLLRYLIGMTEVQTSPSRRRPSPAWTSSARSTRRDARSTHVRQEPGQQIVARAARAAIGESAPSGDATHPAGRRAEIDAGTGRSWG